MVRDVRQSEEWEDVKKSILSVGIEMGRREDEKTGEKRGERRGKRKGEKRGRFHVTVSNRIKVVYLIVTRFPSPLPSIYLLSPAGISSFLL